MSIVVCCNDNNLTRKTGMEPIYDDKGKQIFVWTVNDQDMMSKMIDLNVDSIITDNPFLVNDTIYSKKNDFIKVIADYLF